MRKIRLMPRNKKKLKPKRLKKMLRRKIF